MQNVSRHDNNLVLKYTWSVWKFWLYFQDNKKEIKKYDRKTSFNGNKSFYFSYFHIIIVVQIVKKCFDILNILSCQIVSVY